MSGMRARSKPAVRFIALLGSAAVGLAFCHGATAQDLHSTRTTSLGSASVTVGYNAAAWDESNLTLSQGNAYLRASVPITGSVRFGLLSGGQLTDQKEHRIQGFYDTKAELSFQVRKSMILLLGVNLPTGLTNLDSTNLILSEGIAERLKGYQTNVFGEGWDFNAGAVWAFRLGGITLGLGGGYVVKGEYRFSKQSPDYAPGDQLTLAIGTDLGNKLHLWRVNTAGERYAWDKLGGERAFRLGDRLRIESLYRYRGAPLAGQVRALGVLQADAEIDTVPGIAEAVVRTGSPEEVYLDGQLEVRLHPRLWGIAFGGARLFGESYQGADDGHRFDVGPGAQLLLSRRLGLTAIGSVRYSWGAVRRQGQPGTTPGEIDVNGYAFDVGLVYTRGP